MGPCCWLLPWWADEGLAIGRSRMSQKLPCAWSCCWPRVCISSLPPQPFSLYFYKYIYRNIYDAKCNRDETPHWPGSPCVSISPQTVTYLVPLDVLCYRTGCWVVYILFYYFYYYCFTVCPFPAEGYWGPVACWPWGRVAPQVVGQLPNYAKCLELWCVVQQQAGSAWCVVQVQQAPTSVSTSAKGYPGPLPKYHPQG